MEASVLNKFRINIKIKHPRDIKPPIPSFQSAKIRPVRAIPQIKKIMIISVLKDANGDSLFLFILSIKLAITKNRVNATSNVPLMRAVHLNPL